MERVALPFLDCVGNHDQHGQEAKALARPWQSYWPPEKDSELAMLLQQTVPEVLTWRFDPNNPFDRPWQSWAKNAILSGRVCTSKVLQPENSLVSWNISRNEEPNKKAGDLSKQEEGSRNLDAEIDALQLRHVVPKEFNYLSDDAVYNTTKPYHTRLPFMGKIRRSNIVAQAYSNIKVHDINGNEDKFTLAQSGFQFFHIPFDVGNWTDESAKNQYLPFMEKWLMDYFKAKKVHIFTYTYRCENRERTASESWVGPYMRAHCDVTLNSGLRRLDLHLPDQAEEIRKGRWRMIGLWRALTGPYQDRPLALLDPRSLRQQDLLGADVVFPHYCDEGYEVRHSPHHRWFYKQRMKPDEALIFKLYDSSVDEVRFCPHAAFIDPSVPEGTPQRASIEIRAIIVG